MPTALAISPHLDDAVFSAGGTLARLSRAGWRVIVATVFTASIPDPQGFALACQLDKGLAPEIDYMALRREEDAAACLAIGAEPLWMPFAEAPHRGYRTAAALFAGLRDDDAIVEEIAPVLTKLIHTCQADELFAPQAIGAHVDHVATRLALRAGDRPLRLWADFPYCVRASLLPESSPHEAAGCAEEIIELGDADLKAKIDGVAAYASQLGFQFGSAAAAETAIKSVGAVERFIKRRL